MSGTVGQAKEFATLQAIAALHGVTLHRLEGDYGTPVYVATRWAMTKQLDTLEEVEDWLQRVTGKPVTEVPV
ncbi:hypothetical protein [Rhodoferax sp. GW822-FHT02A01]|uniref:hypothetical protein n=1 Tax=Rhodoferax sp. GW822-FHT02A01 TaxID=3141537 RepID=UPI00315CB20D